MSINISFYLIGTQIYARILQWIKAVRRSSPVKFYRSRCWLGERRLFTSEILSFVFRSTEAPQNLTFGGEKFAGKSQYQQNKQITSYKKTHSFAALTRSFSDTSLNSWIKTVRAHFPWSNLYICVVTPETTTNYRQQRKLNIDDGVARST